MKKMNTTILLILLSILTLSYSKPLSSIALANKFNNQYTDILNDPNNYLDTKDSILQILSKINTETKYFTRVYLISEMKHESISDEIEEYLDLLSYHVLNKNKEN
jgi:hypothetical protein